MDCGITEIRVLEVTIIAECLKEAPGIFLQHQPHPAAPKHDKKENQDL